jgi:hypothetical protein
LRRVCFFASLTQGVATGLIYARLSAFKQPNVISFINSFVEKCFKVTTVDIQEKEEEFKLTLYDGI